MATGPSESVGVSWAWGRSAGAPPSVFSARRAVAQSFVQTPSHVLRSRWRGMGPVTEKWLPGALYFEPAQFAATLILHVSTDTATSIKSKVSLLAVKTRGINAQSL